MDLRSWVNLPHNVYCTAEVQNAPAENSNGLRQKRAIISTIHQLNRKFLIGFPSTSQGFK